jgi:hypothetical protein
MRGDPDERIHPLAVVSIEVAGMGLDAVLDTGCQGSAISEKFLRRYIDAREYTCIEVVSPRGADDKPLQCDTKIYLPVLFGNLAVIVGFYIVKNLSVDALIGQDILIDADLRQTDKILDFKRHEIQLAICYKYAHELRNQEAREDVGILHISFPDEDALDDLVSIRDKQVLLAYSILPIRKRTWR